MGQQQLLLLVLATVVVGFATVAGIEAFDQGQVRANQDALTSTAVKIASDAQARIREPEQFGGYGDDINDGSTLTLEELGYSTRSATSVSDLSGPVYRTSDGECGFTDATLDGSVRIVCESDDNRVEVVMDGLESDDITTDKTRVKS